MEDIAKRVATMEADLAHYRAKSDADDTMISVLKRQNETQAMEMEQMAHDHANELRRVRQRCDLAVQRETGITGILNAAATGIVDGMRRMKGDEERKADLQSKTEDSPVARPAPEPSLLAAPNRPQGEEIRDGAAGVRDLMKRLPPNRLTG